jgi:hypothetical protein
VSPSPPGLVVQSCLLPPVFLDYYVNGSGGYDVIGLFHRLAQARPALTNRYWSHRLKHL